MRDRPWIFHCAALLLFAVGFATVRAAETIPPPPANHFNDYARVVRPETAAQLNRELAQFERETSNQILVAIFPRLQSDSSVEDYAVRVAQSWRVGQKARDNGAVLFLFQQSRDVRIVTGYGLEGALPDALCKQIIEAEMIPRFRAGDFDAGLTAGVRAMMAATRGEYRGAGRLAADGTSRGKTARGSGVGAFVVMMIVIMLINRRARRGGMLYGGRGRRSIWLGPSGWGGGRGGWGGGGGGTFSGGGGSFGGGGAGGKW